MQKQEDCNIIQVLKGHRSTVTALKMHSRGNCLISGSNDNTIRIWNRNRDEFECKQILCSHIDTITSFITDSFNQIFYSASLDKNILGWKYSEKKQSWLLESFNVNEHKMMGLKYDRNLNGCLFFSLSTDGNLTKWTKLPNSQISEKEII